MSKRVDLLQGSIAGALTRLALPIMATSLIQMAYNMVDMIWIGRVGAGAVASVGAAGMFMWLSGGLVVLARMGGQVRMAQHLGAGRQKEAVCYAQNSLQLGILLSVLFTLLLVLGASPLIAFFRLNDPTVVKDAEIYLQIVGAGMFFSFVNQILATLITTSGNSRTPLYATATGLGINLVLDPVLIFGPGPLPVLGVAGAALATVLAQAIVTVVLWIYIRQDTHLFQQMKLLSSPQWPVIRDILRLSLPSALQSVLFPLISMVIARLIAGWGDNAVAVQKVGSQIESISWMTADGFSVAVNSFVAQNFGAGNLQRARKGYWISAAIVAVWGVFCTLLLVLGAAPIFRFFIPDEAVLPMGVSYLQILGFSELFMCIEIITAGAYAGFGRTLPPSLVSILLTAARIPLAMALSATSLGLDGIWWSISFSSMAKGLLLFSMFCFFLSRIARQKKIG